MKHETSSRRASYLLLLSLLCLQPLTAQADWEDDAAFAAFDSLRQRAISLPDDSVATKSLCFHKAGLLASRNGDNDQAVALTERALALRLTQPAEQADGILLSTYNLGTYYEALGELPEALNYFADVIALAPNRKEGFAWFQTGRLYGKVGKFEAGVNAFTRALRLPPFSKDDYLTALAQEHLGQLHLEKNSRAGGLAAIPPLRQALAYYADAGDDFDYEEMTTRNYLGWALTEAGDYPAAIAELTKARELAVAMEIEDEDLTAILSNLGLAFRRSGATEQALTNYRTALAIERGLLQDDVTSVGLAVIYDNLSTFYLKQSQPDSALHYAQQALRYTVAGYSPGQPDDLPELALLTSHQPSLLLFLSDLALAHHTAGQAGLALRAYHLADDLLDRMQQDQLLENTRAYWRADARGLYEQAMAAAVAIKDTKAAFYFAEKARARLLLDEFSATRADHLLPGSASRRLNTAAKLARRSAGAPNLTNRFQHLQDSIFSAFPAYARARIGSPPPALDRLPSLLDGRTLVEYFIADTMALALVQSGAEEPRMVELAPLAEWWPQLSSLRIALTDPSLPYPADAALRLYQTLITPLQLPADAPLVIIPDGPLYQLPFGALLTDLPEEMDPSASWPWLANQRAIAYGFSAQLLATARRTGNGRVLALAPVARIDPAGGLDPRLELPATLRTVRHLAELFPTNTLINAAATPAAFRQHADDYSLIHLGTHAYLDDGGSFLLNDTAQRHYTAERLNEHQLNAELVVIAGCETGLGEELIGEGVASLGRSFARRGAPNLVMSLWSINDATTADLLESTYDGLAEGVGPANALHKAGLNYRAKVTNPTFGHPYYWAGLVYYGAERPLSLAATLRPPWFLIGFCLAFLVGLGLIIVKKRRGSTTPRKG